MAVAQSAQMACSPQLRAFIDRSLRGERIELDEETKEQLIYETVGFLKNRPVVVLKKGSLMVCYKRPGILPEIHEAFIKQYMLLDQPPYPLLDHSRRNIFDRHNPPLCSKHKDDLKALFKVCEKVGLLRELYLEVITHPQEYLTISGGIPRTRDCLGEPPEISFSPLDLC